MVYNHNFVQVGNQYFYAKDGNFYKTAKIEEETAVAFTKLYIYEPDLNQLNYVTTRNNVDGSSINKKVKGLCDSIKFAITKPLY